MTKRPQIHKALVTIEGSNDVLSMDVIEHEGGFWLVPAWLDTPDGRWTRPARIIPLARLRYHRMRKGGPADFLLEDPLPRDVHDGTAPSDKARRYGVKELPEMILRAAGL